MRECFALAYSHAEVAAKPRAGGERDDCASSHHRTFNARKGGAKKREEQGEAKPKQPTDLELVTELHQVVVEVGLDLPLLLLQHHQLLVEEVRQLVMVPALVYTRVERRRNVSHCDDQLFAKMFLFFSLEQLWA